MEKILSEDYCSFELSKLLKEKGFDCDCKGYDAVTGVTTIHNWKSVDGLTPCCTHQLAMKWLRDIHHIHIMISIGFDEGRMFYHANFAQFEKDRITYGDPIVDDFSTNEEAVEAALKYTLENLI